MNNISTIRIPREMAHTHKARELILQACFDGEMTLQGIASELGHGHVDLKGTDEERSVYRHLQHNLHQLISVGLIVPIKPKQGYAYRYKALYLGYAWVMPGLCLPPQRKGNQRPRNQRQGMACA